MSAIPYTDLQCLYIDGQYRKPLSNQYENVDNPATEEIIGKAPVAGVADATAAIAAARNAFDNGPWPRMTMKERCAIMLRFRDALLRHEQDVRKLLLAEVGSTHLLLNGPQFCGAIEAIERCVELAERIRPEPTDVVVTPSIFDPSAAGTLGGGVTYRDPYGVVAGISPYNFPLLVSMTKIAPALVVGNCLVLKPSPFTPFSTLMLGKIADEAGLPPGVLNIITGGAEVGGLMCSDPRVDLVSFTGSETVGKAVAVQSAQTLKQVHLELGGKSALIVRHDADVFAAAALASYGFTVHAGQGCAILSRFIVHNSIRKEFVEAMKTILSQIKVGDPAEPDTVVGPLISNAAREKAEYFTDIGQTEGAKLVFGGRRPAHLKQGYFFEPTLFDDVNNRSSLAQEEVFGPVGVVIGYDHDDEAVAMANDSVYGLSGGIQSRDKVRAFEMAKQLRTGDVRINGGTGGLYLPGPFGGYKRSGVGREFGPEWLDTYLLKKSIQYPVG
jgi:acyl-CoA reductase-like NAD-dependent aldehyde dehydrogenase